MNHPIGTSHRSSKTLFAGLSCKVCSVALLTNCGRDPLTASNIADFIENNRPPEGTSTPADGSATPAIGNAPTADPNQVNNQTEVNSVTPPADDAVVPNLPAALFEYAAVTLPAHFRQGGRGGTVVAADNTPTDNPITNPGATPGRVLFYDKQLSANNTVSCASCHQQSAGFADPVPLSTGFEGGLTGRRSMGLTNARFYDRGRFFWDERAATLEDQVLSPIQDAVEMGMNLDDLVTKLSSTNYYGPLFEDAFGSRTVTSERISRSLAQFVRSMVSFQSKYDAAFVNGNPDFRNVLTAEEDRGRRIFDQNCANCHETNGQISDQPRNTGLDAVTTDEGAGRGRFKSPSLRNIAVRAPYMHDGRFETLREVVNFYNTGIQRNPNLDNRLRARGGAPRRMNLDANEINALITFIEALTDNTFLTDPKFSNPFE
jgi:cytochrome c peroxidase